MYFVAHGLAPLQICVVIPLGKSSAQAKTAAGKTWGNTINWPIHDRQSSMKTGTSAIIYLSGLAWKMNPFITVCGIGSCFMYSGDRSATDGKSSSQHRSSLRRMSVLSDGVWVLLTKCLGGTQSWHRSTLSIDPTISLGTMTPLPQAMGADS